MVHQPVSRGLAVFADAWLSDWLAEISRRLTGNGSASEVVLHNDALYKSTTLLFSPTDPESFDGSRKSDVAFGLSAPDACKAKFPQSLSISTYRKINVKNTVHRHVNGKIAKLKQQISELGFLVVVHIAFVVLFYIIFAVLIKFVGTRHMTN